MFPTEQSSSAIAIQAVAVSAQRFAVVHCGPLWYVVACCGMLWHVSTVVWVFVCDCIVWSLSVTRSLSPVLAQFHKLLCFWLTEYASYHITLNWVIAHKNGQGIMQISSHKIYCCEQRIHILYTCTPKT